MSPVASYRSYTVPAPKPVRVSFDQSTVEEGLNAPCPSTWAELPPPSESSLRALRRPGHELSFTGKMWRVAGIVMGTNQAVRRLTVVEKAPMAAPNQAHAYGSARRLLKGLPISRVPFSKAPSAKSRCTTAVPPRNEASDGVMSRVADGLRRMASLESVAERDLRRAAEAAAPMSGDAEAGAAPAQRHLSSRRTPSASI